MDRRGGREAAAGRRKLTRGWAISSFLAVCYFTLLVWHPVNYTALLFLDGTLEGTYATPLLIPTETGQWIIAAEKHKWQDHPINASCFGKRISVADVPELNDDGHSRAITMEEQLRSKVAHRYVEEWLRPHRDTVRPARICSVPLSLFLLCSLA